MPPADLLRQGEEIAATRNIDPRYKSRVIAVNMVLSGRNTVAQAAKLVGVSRMSVNDWVRTADQEGFEALKDKKRGGRKPRLSADQKQELRAALQKPPPKNYRVWDGISLSAYIKERFGVYYSVRSYQYLFHELGFSRIRPQTYPCKGHENAP